MVINHQRLVIINRIDNEFWQMKLFEPSDNAWFELLCFDFDSLMIQASVIYNIDIREYSN
jgi:hypothetical protein